MLIFSYYKEKSYSLNRLDTPSETKNPSTPSVNMKRRGLPLYKTVYHYKWPLKKNDLKVFDFR